MSRLRRPDFKEGEDCCNSLVARHTEPISLQAFFRPETSDIEIRHIFGYAVAGVGCFDFPVTGRKAPRLISLCLAIPGFSLLLLLLLLSTTLSHRLSLNASYW